MNDLLDAMHSREYLAGRSLTGGNSSKGDSSKDALDKDDVVFIIGKPCFKQLYVQLTLKLLYLNDDYL